MLLEDLHTLFLSCSGGVVIDTRKMVKDCFFVALKGDNFNANTFASNALSSGAKIVLIDDAHFYINENTILVEDCLKTLQSLAKFHRKFLNTRIIALTGSNGKTTTKELIYSVLSKKFNTLATNGNFNNHIGVPLTLLRLNSSHEMAVVEMGANHQKEIEFLCDIAQPDFGYITNFGKAHLEGFGGVEGVIKGKSEMYVHLIENSKFIFINADDMKQMEKAKDGKLITFATDSTKMPFFLFNQIEADPFVTVNFHDYTFMSNLTGIYNATNVIAAISMGLYFDLKIDDIQKAIKEYLPDNNRSQIIDKNSNKILLDAYNANPSSMIVAITHFVNYYKKDKVLFLGDMFELGEQTKEEHTSIVHFMKDQGDSICFFIGKYFYDCKIDADHLFFFENISELQYFLNSYPIQNKAILIKGSRGIALEQVLEMI
ncbi:MAG: UDP-N-acetylmuramoyl-tripeptide--D-alanyl-D-alanine ligase [Flavobacterium sp.]